MSINLLKLGIEGVIKEIGMYLPRMDIVQCFSDERLMGWIVENENLTERELVKYIKEHQKNFDLNRYIFANYLMISGKKKIPGYNMLSKISNRQYKIELIEEHLRSHPIVLVDTDGIRFGSKVYDSRDYSSKEQAAKHMKDVKAGLERIKRIDEKIGMPTLLMIQILSDMQLIYCKVPELGDAMRNNIIINTHKGDEDMTKERLVDIMRGIEISKKSFWEYIPQFQEELMQNAEYIDWDKFLLLSAARAKHTLEKVKHEDFPANNQEILISIMQIALEEIDNPKARISGEIEYIGEPIGEIKYSVRDLQKDLEERVIDGKYYGKAELDKLKEDLLTGKIKISDIYSQRILALMNLNKKEVQQCMNQTYENVIDLYRNGFITEEELRSYLSSITMDAQAIRNLNSLKNESGEKVLTNQDLLELYLNGNIELEEFRKIDEIKDTITESELIKYYKKLKDCTPEEKRRIERYFSLYREIRISGKKDEEKNEIGNSIILELGDDMQTEDFIELYTRNLITLETIVDWNTEEFALIMFKRGLLKPIDSKKLLNSGKVDINKIKAGLLNGLTDEEKLSTIITMFDDEGSEEIREELFQTLQISDEEKAERKSGTSQRTKAVSDKARGKEYELDPCYKIQLLERIDKDYTAKLTRDGHMIFELPNLNKVIIEKMFKRTKSGISNANGAATYILDLDTLNSEEIIIDEKINRSRLYELAKESKVKRYYHTKNWGDAIKEIFDIEHSSRHTAEDKKQIDDIIEKTKRTRKLRTIR